MNPKPAGLLLILLSSCSLPAWALRVGDCLPEARARAQLASEGQKIVRVPPTVKNGPPAWFTSNASSGQGYFLKARPSGDYCVESVLSGLGTATLRAQEKSTQRDICAEPNRSVQVTDVCHQLKQAGLDKGRTEDATSPQSLLDNTLKGPVTTRFVICPDKGGGEVVCGMAETSQSKPKP